MDWEVLICAYCSKFYKYLSLGLLHRDSGQNLLLHSQILTQASPAIQQALLNDDKWDYDIIALEKVTNKR